MNNTIIDNDLVAIMLETFDRGQSFLFVPKGKSMRPLLNGSTDSVTLSKKPDTLSKYDVVMFIRRSDNTLIIHRIIKVNSDSTYNISGDFLSVVDKNVPESDILAVVTAFTHNGKDASVSSFTYQLYSRLILFKKYFHILLSKIYHLVFK